MYVTKINNSISGFATVDFAKRRRDRRATELIACEIVSLASLALAFGLALASSDLRAAGAFIASAFLFLAVWVAVRVTHHRFVRRRAAARAAVDDIIDKFMGIAIQNELIRRIFNAPE